MRPIERGYTHKQSKMGMRDGRRGVIFQGGKGVRDRLRGAHATKKTQVQREGKMRDRERGYMIQGGEGPEED
jgi:hypothetical protein